MELSRLSFFVSVVALSLGSGSAYAQESDDGALDVTMTLMPADAELPDAVTRELELPRDSEDDYQASDDGVANSTDGLDTANTARSGGLAVAADNAAEALATAAEAAAGSREELGRENAPDGLPDRAPDVPAELAPELPGGAPNQLPAAPPTPPAGAPGS